MRLQFDVRFSPGEIAIFFFGFSSLHHPTSNAFWIQKLLLLLFFWDNRIGIALKKDFKQSQIPKYRIDIVYYFIISLFLSFDAFAVLVCM